MHVIFYPSCWNAREQCWQSPHYEAKQGPHTASAIEAWQAVNALREALAARGIAPQPVTQAYTN